MHIRCPHCQHAVEVVGTEEFASVSCPSCGSSFDLAPPTTSFWPSRRTIGHFQLLDQLGTGGSGTVWKARDTKLDRLVAIKVPRVDHSDPEHAELFLREARAAAQLRHPQIVAVHEVGRDDGTLYIVSDFVDGVTLADRLTADPFTPREAAELLAQVAEAHLRMGDIFLSVGQNADPQPSGVSEAAGGAAAGRPVGNASQRGHCAGCWKRRNWCGRSVL